MSKISRSWSSLRDDSRGGSLSERRLLVDLQEPPRKSLEEGFERVFYVQGINGYELKVGTF
jgi:hypothetical protein